MTFVTVASLFEAKKDSKDPGRKELRVRPEPTRLPVDRGAPRVIKTTTKPKPKKPHDGNEKDVVQKNIDSQTKRKKTIALKQKKALAQAAADNKVTRQARIAAIKAKAQPPRPAGIGTVPAQIAHCMMAVHIKRGKSKEAAWNICRWAMTKYGYLKGPYRVNAKLPKTTRATAKGAKRNFQHGMEKQPLNGGVKGNGPAKFKKFVKMFKSFEPKMLPKGAEKGLG